MSSDVKEFYQKFAKDSEKMKAQMPEMINGFMAFFGKVMGDGAMSVKEKEMVALGIALGIQCEPCILLHVKKCLDAGVTKEQILEVCGVAAMMAGGPGFTHAPMVMDALEANGQ